MPTYRVLRIYDIIFANVFYLFIFLLILVNITYFKYTSLLCLGASIPTSSISIMRPNIEVMCIVKFQYATSAMLALPYDHFLVSLLFLDVPITVIVPSLLLTSFLNVFI